MHEAKRPIAFVLGATVHGPMIINRNDYHTLPDGQAYGVGHQLLTRSSFDEGEIELIQHLLVQRRKHFSDGVVLLDCGANIGVHTVACAKLMHNWGKVLSFEPQEAVYYALAGNIVLNNCFNARAVQAAVGRETGSIAVPHLDPVRASSYGSLELRRSPNNEFIGQAVSYEHNAQDVPMKSLDSLNLARVDLIKLDIEGMEEEALLGAQACLTRHRPILHIEHIKSDLPRMFAFLESFGYSCHTVGINLLAIHRDDPCALSVRIA